MKILFVATEMDPFFKVGGLGDVIGSLPLELSRLELDITIVLPFYKSIDPTKFKIHPPAGGSKFQIECKFAERIESVEVYQIDYRGVAVCFLENQKYITDYDKVAFAGDQKEVDHYAFFSRAVVEWLVQSDQQYDVVHLHDWHVGLVPRLWKLRVDRARQTLSRQAMRAGSGELRFIFTIHNLGYHGFSEIELVKRLGIDNLKTIRDDPYFEFDAREDDQLDLLLQGILSSDLVTTVSPSYAKEIQTPEFCEGLCDVLQIRSDRLVGILNGLDYERWNPATDRALSNNFSLDENGSRREPFSQKRPNKLALQKELGLQEKGGVVVLGFVGRLDPAQKGLDILYAAVDQLLQEGRVEFQFVLIGEGDTEWEERFRQMAKQQPGRVAARLEFNDQLARRIYAGSDVMLIPSRYEPCGLVQMIAMRYGAIPVVRATGGLKDTVEHGRDGFVFEYYATDELVEQTKNAIAKYYEQPQEWSKMVTNAMRNDFSWGRSAKKYVEAYREVVRSQNAEFSF